MDLTILTDNISVELISFLMLKMLLILKCTVDI